MSLLDTGTRVLQSLYPPDNGGDPKKWRRSVFIALLLLIVTTSLSFAELRGWLGVMGISEIARADQVDQKIAAAVAPINKALERMDTRSISILRALFLPQIRAKVRERCDNPGAKEREAINKELTRLLDEYRDAAGEPFAPMPNCDEV